MVDIIRIVIRAAMVVFLLTSMLGRRAASAGVAAPPAAPDDADRNKNSHSRQCITGRPA
jgi:hypothetical protein